MLQSQYISRYDGFHVMSTVNENDQTIWRKKGTVVTVAMGSLSTTIRTFCDLIFFVLHVHMREADRHKHTQTVMHNVASHLETAQESKNYI